MKIAKAPDWERREMAKKREFVPPPIPVPKTLFAQRLEDHPYVVALEERITGLENALVRLAEATLSLNGDCHGRISAKQRVKDWQERVRAAVRDPSEEPTPPILPF